MNLLFRPSWQGPDLVAFPNIAFSLLCIKLRHLHAPSSILLTASLFLSSLSCCFSNQYQSNLSNDGFSINWSRTLVQGQNLIFASKSLELTFLSCSKTPRPGMSCRTLLTPCPVTPTSHTSSLAPGLQYGSWPVTFPGTAARNCNPNRSPVSPLGIAGD